MRAAAEATSAMNSNPSVKVHHEHQPGCCPMMSPCQKAAQKGCRLRATRYPFVDLCYTPERSGQLPHSGRVERLS